jgi:hypothetical protein
MYVYYQTRLENYPHLGRNIYLYYINIFIEYLDFF